MANIRNGNAPRYSVTGARYDGSVLTLMLRNNAKQSACAYMAIGNASGIMPPTLSGSVTTLHAQTSVIYGAARAMRYLARIAHGSVAPHALAALFTHNGIVHDTAMIEIPNSLS